MMVMIVGCTTLVTETEAKPSSFEDCYKNCMGGCIKRQPFSFFKCPKICALECKNHENAPSPSSPSPSSAIHADDDQSSALKCEIDCVTSRCAGLTKKPNPNDDEIEACFHSCFSTCKKN
ncbi:PREDICTED: uncharacterized protein LOC104818205 [Tarenaya hassleriana]|uniref:uncharacterized protein LOC104818205 n=1 Tax=Tarenaya hassleriana TaxID=28532 RepID=UPI00053C6456|nr:PREDICTED: uncharacterized protein LOC104818205 [Tarenaya hassleriana]